MKILRFLFWSFLSVLLFIAGAGAAAGHGSPLAALQAVFFFLQLLFTGRFEQAFNLVIGLAIHLASSYLGLVLIVVFIIGIGTTVGFLSKMFKGK